MLNTLMDEDKNCPVCGTQMVPIRTETARTELVFHPAYLVLGSMISFVIFLIYPVIVAKRIRNEEAVLEKELDGYSAYKKKVKYKVIPFIW